MNTDKIVAEKLYNYWMKQAELEKEAASLGNVAKGGLVAALAAGAGAGINDASTKASAAKAKVAPALKEEKSSAERAIKEKMFKARHGYGRSEGYKVHSKKTEHGPDEDYIFHGDKKKRVYPPGTVYRKDYGSKAKLPGGED